MKKTFGHTETKDLDGKKIRYHYKSGLTYDQEYKEGTVTWTGIEGPNVGYSQTEKKIVNKVGDNIYFISWFENETKPSALGESRKDGFVVSIVVDLKNMIATASYNEPIEGGGQKWMVDKAWVEYVG